MLEPKFENSAPLLIAGHAPRFSAAEMDNIPALWAHAGPALGSIPGAVGPEAYGVNFSNRPLPRRYEYIAGMTVENFGKLPLDLSHVTINSPRYAVFSCNGLPELRPLLDRMMQTWLPNCGIAMLGEPDFLERYTKEFDPMTGQGRIDVMVPLKA
ncbi:MAG TPA: effector binding domain-containing protein [Rhizomicrobium sp.]|jgi:AraC family transcriptional regulator